MLEAGVAGPRVVDRHEGAGGAVVVEVLGNGAVGGDGGVLGDLDDDAREARLRREGGPHRRMADRLGAQVDGEEAARRQLGPVAEAGSQGGRLELAAEARRPSGPEPRLRPGGRAGEACERLVADDGARAEVDDRLEGGRDGTGAGAREAPRPVGCVRVHVVRSDAAGGQRHGAVLRPGRSPRAPARRAGWACRARRAPSARGL